MEQSIKSVLVKQTIAHQQQQLTNLQVRYDKLYGALRNKTLYCGAGCELNVDEIFWHFRAFSMQTSLDAGVGFGKALQVLFPPLSFETVHV